jgi:hypothetical protein
MVCGPYRLVGGGIFVVEGICVVVVKDQVKVIAPTVMVGTDGRVGSKERKVIVAGSVDFS